MFEYFLKKLATWQVTLERGTFYHTEDIVIKFYSASQRFKRKLANETRIPPQNAPQKSVIWIP